MWEEDVCGSSPSDEDHDVENVKKKVTFLVPRMLLSPSASASASRAMIAPASSP